jgi:hypothetical protein
VAAAPHSQESDSVWLGWCWGDGGTGHAHFIITSQEMGAAVFRVTSMRSDKFLLWPTIVVTGVSIVEAFFIKIPGDFGFSLGFYDVLLDVFVWPWVFIIISVILFYFGRWKNSVSIVLTPVISGLTMYLLHDPIMFSCDFFHLLIEKPAYEREIEGLSAPPGSRITNWDWSFGLAGSGATVLIYDETDLISQPFGKQSSSMKAYAGWAEPCAGKVEHISGHYYLCFFE